MSVEIISKKCKYVYSNNLVPYIDYKIKVDGANSDFEECTLNNAKQEIIAILKNIDGTLINNNKTIYGIKNATITGKTIACGYLKAAYVNFDNLICRNGALLYNSSINKLVLNNPYGLYSLDHVLCENIIIENVESNDFALYIENSQFNNLILKGFVKNNKNITIFIKDCTINNQIVIDDNFKDEADGQITLIKNVINSSIIPFIKCNNEFLDLKDNIYINSLIGQENEKELKYLKYTGYRPLKNDLNLNSFDIKPYCYYNCSNIPQYVSYENDPALQTGCEATACAILLSYILNKKITKNEIADKMPKGNPGEDDFWDKFIGDIYGDGWGTMSPVCKVAIDSYLKENQLDSKYEVINTTNTSLIKLLRFISTNNPVVAYATMGNDDTMYCRKYGSTKWTINDRTLYWPGRDHALVIVGYNLAKCEIYLADPEVSSSEIRTRNLLQFANRFAQLYNQSLIIKERS